MTTYDTTFTIAAPPARVWEVLTDFPRYGEWNTAVPSVSGALSVGSTLSIRLDMSGKPMDVSAEVQDVEPERRFGWRGHLGTEFLFTGIREFTIEPLEENTSSFRHYESIRGVLVPAFRLLKGEALVAHHHGFNRSVKQRAEALSAMS